VKEDHKYRLVLEQPQLGTSCKLTRRFGSKAIIRVKLPRGLVYAENKQLGRFLLRPVVIWGRRYEFLYAKDTTALFFETTKMSLRQLIEWANPLAANQNQVCLLLCGVLH
jgi:RNA-dependent RNA polymerase